MRWYYFDATPTMTANDTDADSDTVWLNFTTSEIVTVNWTLGLTCGLPFLYSGDNASNNTFNLTQDSLSYSTTYYYNITLTDADYSVSYCIPITTGFSCVECVMYNWNTSIDCSYNYTDNSTGAFLKEYYCNGGENRMIIAAIIILPALFGLFMLLGSFFLGDEHVPLKIAMFLITPIAFWASLHMGLISVIKFYDFTELQDLIGRTTYWTGTLFFVMLCYFLLYIFTKAIHTAAEKKKERLAY